jgi:hypothetical protein
MADLEELSDEEQVELLEQTDNGPKSDEDAIKTSHLPQNPGSVVNDYERYPGPT